MSSNSLVMVSLCHERVESKCEDYFFPLFCFKIIMSLMGSLNESCTFDSSVFQFSFAKVTEAVLVAHLYAFTQISLISSHGLTVQN